MWFLYVFYFRAPSEKVKQGTLAEVTAEAVKRAMTIHEDNLSSMSIEYHDADSSDEDSS
jgi:hypothetical protein